MATTPTLVREPAEPNGWSLEGGLASFRRLPFQLHEFVRSTWTGPRAREVWAPRLARISRAWAATERAAVGAGVRACVLTSQAPRALPEYCASLADDGLHVLPLAAEGVPTAGYSAQSSAPQDDGPFQFRVVAGSTAAVREFRRAWHAGDDEAIGRLLGYPECCRAFFRTVWKSQRFLDTSWGMALNTTRPREVADCVEVTGHAHANILWRWLGVRAVPHLPCSFACEATVAFAGALQEVARRIGFAEEVDWLTEMLSWPIEWSAVHGIGQVRTPILKFVMTSDATPVRYVIRKKGTSYPEEGARGIVFPYRGEGELKLSASRSFQGGIAQPIRTVAADDPSGQPSYWSDNGFASKRAMDAAHGPIVRAIQQLLRERPGDGPVPRVMDLGCGNGALLRRIQSVVPGVSVFGCELEASRHARIAKVLPDEFARGNFSAGSMFGPGLAVWTACAHPDIVILMPGRLLEAETSERGALMERLRTLRGKILAYAYDDYAKAHGGFKGLVEKAGLVLCRRFDGDVGLVTVREDTP